MTKNPPAPDRPSLREALENLGIEFIHGVPVHLNNQAVNDIIATLADYLTGAAPEKQEVSRDWSRIDNGELPHPDTVRARKFGERWAEGFNAAIDEYTANIKRMMGKK